MSQPAPPPPPEPSSARLTLTLGLAGLLSGLLLVMAWSATLPRILLNRAEALESAVLRLLPGTKRIVPYVVRDGRLAPFPRQGRELPAEEAVYGGFGDDGVLVGYAVPAAGPGFADVIEVLYGFDARARTVVGMEVLASRETPGLGDKIDADADFHASLKALQVEPRIVGQKRGKPTKPNEVDIISGATISSEAVVKLLNKSTQRWLPLLDPALKAPAKESP